MNIVRSILVVLIMLGVLATLHELGHFWVARLLNIKVFEVSLFVGPKLLSWQHKGVDFSVRLVPIGAYVRFSEVDEEGYAVESDDPSLLVNQPRFKRLLVSLAGPVMNLLLGFLIFFIMFWATGFVSTKIGTPLQGAQTGTVADDYTVGDTIKAVNGVNVYSSYDLYYEMDSADPSEVMTLTLKSQETGKTYELDLTPEFKTRPMFSIMAQFTTVEPYGFIWLVHSVDEEQNLGNPILEPGDYVTHVNGKYVGDEDFDEFIYNLTDEVLTITYVRDGESFDSEIIPTYADFVTDRGVRLVACRINSPSNLVLALSYAAKMPASIGNITVRGIKSIISGKEKAYNLVSGPIGITTMVNDVVKDERDTVGDKIYVLVMLSAVISIALAFSNLLPIPGLDGIQIVFIAVEMIIGHKLSKKAEGVLTVIGFVMIVLILILAFISDILRIIFGY